MENIVKNINILGRKYGSAQVFDDFLQMGVCALAQQTYEEEYFRRIKKYNKSDLDLFPIMFADMVLLFEKTLNKKAWCDFLGNIMESINLTNQRNGQFLTPEAVCTLMAQIQGDFTDKSVSDPSVGTGRLLLATINRGKGLPKYVEGIDVDLRACNISTLNLFFHGLRGRIVWGNSLSLETYRVYEINLNKDYPIKVIDNSDYLRSNFKSGYMKQKATTGYGDLFSLF